jgi:hypothetical protein
VVDFRCRCSLSAGRELSLLGLCPAGSQLSRYSRRSRAPSATINCIGMEINILPYTFRKNHFFMCIVVDFSLNSKILFHLFLSLVSSVMISLLDGEGDGVDSCRKTDETRSRSECEEACSFVRRKAKPFPSPSIPSSHRQSLGISYVRKQQPLGKVLNIKRISGVMSVKKRD